MPSKKPETPKSENNPWSETGEYLKEHPVARNVANALMQITVYTASFFVFGPKRTMRMRDPQYVGGLCHGSIIAQPLYYPTETKDVFNYDSADAGRWMGYDFLRHNKFPLTPEDKLRRLRKGRLIAYLLEDIKDNEPDEKTRAGSLRFDIDSLLCMDSHTPDQLVTHGMLALTNYRDAYKAVGREQDIPALESRSLADDPVYQVTPKGNTLVVLMPDGGQSSSRRDTESAPAFNMIPGLPRLAAS